MWLTRVSIRRPVLLLTVLSVVLILGVLAWSRLGVDLFPADNSQIVTITTIYPGAGPDVTDTLVTQPIENSLSSMSDIDYIASTSVEGVSSVAVVFTDRASSGSSSEVERRVSSIRGSLPAEIRAPTVGRFNPTDQPILYLALSSKVRNPDQMQTIANGPFKSLLDAVPGVGQVAFIGGVQREIQVQVDQQKLQARGLSILQVTQALSTDNISVPAGSLVQRGQDWNVRLNATAQTPSDLGSVLITPPLASLAGPVIMQALPPALRDSASAAGLSATTSPIRLRDVATIVEGLKQVRTVQRTNGQQALGVTIVKQAQANTVQTADAVKAALQTARSELPPDVEVGVVSDASVFTRAAINDVQRELAGAVVLTGLVLLLFLHTLRSTFIVLLAIPTSLIATLGVMYVLGLSLNMMSLMGLTLTVGILVDDSIVVLENVFRHLQLGETPREAAVNGRSEIGLAAVAITLVDVVVFVPIAFLSGTVGAFSRQFGLVVVTATLFSLVVSFTLTPMLASRWYSGARYGDAGFRKVGRTWNPLVLFGRTWDRGYSALERGYRAVLRGALWLRWLVVLLGILSFAGGLYLVRSGILPTEFLPDADQNQLQVTLEMDAGTTLAVTDDAAQRVEDALRRWPEVNQVFTSVGVGGPGNATLNRSRYATLQVELKPRSQRGRSVQDLAEAARQLGNLLPSGAVHASTVGLMGGGGSSSVQVRVQGPDAEVLSTLATRVAAAMRKVPGIADVSDGGVRGQPELVATFDHERAADAGLTPAQVAAVLRTGLTGSTVSTFRGDDGSGTDVTVVLSPDQRGSDDQLPSIPIVTPRGTTIHLGEIAQVSSTTGPTQVTRRDHQRTVFASATLRGDRPLGDVTRDVQTAIDALSIPTGYTVVQGGAASNQQDSFSQITQALIVSVVLMYLLLVALFDSALLPLVIMLSLPLGIVGAFGLLVVSGNTLNVMSMIGLILLTGLIGKNAILLVDYTNQLRKHGFSRREALLEAGPTRLRPILMTTAALVLAMLPVALKLGEGSEWRAPMAVTLIGGLVTSTLLTLVFIPAVYTIVDDVQNWLVKLPSRVWRRVYARRRPVLVGAPWSPVGEPSNGVPSNGVPPNGVPSNGVPSNGVPPNGVPPNGVPSNGVPSNGVHASRVGERSSDSAD